MFVRDLIMSCLRRWYLLLIGLILTAVAAFAVFDTVPPTYEAKASMVLVPPQVAVTKGDNPFLYLGGLDQALGVLQVKVTAPEIAGPLVEQYEGTEVSVARDDATSGPILVVSVAGPDQTTTMGLLREMQKAVPQTLAVLQDQLKVPESSVITMLPLATDEKPTVVRKKQIQLTAVGGALGAGGTVLLTGLADGLLIRRRERRGDKTVSTTGAKLPPSSVGSGSDEGATRKPSRLRRAKKKANTAVPSKTELTQPSSDNRSVMSRSENRS